MSAVPLTLYLCNRACGQIKHIFEKGDPQTLNQNGQHTVNTIGPMQWFGGMALHTEDGCTRMASIVAIENTLLMAIPRSDYSIAVVRVQAPRIVHLTSCSLTLASIHCAARY